MGYGVDTSPGMVPASELPTTVGTFLGGTGEERVQLPQHKCLHLFMARVCQQCCHRNSSFGLSSAREKSHQQRLQQAEPEGHVFSAAAEMRSLQNAPSIICCGEPTGSKSHL